MLLKVIQMITDSLNKQRFWAGMMAQQKRTLTALSEELGLIPSTHLVANNFVQFSFQGI